MLDCDKKRKAALVNDVVERLFAIMFGKSELLLDKISDEDKQQIAFVTRLCLDNKDFFKPFIIKIVNHSRINDMPAAVASAAAFPSADAAAEVTDDEKRPQLKSDRSEICQISLTYLAHFVTTWDANTGIDFTNPAVMLEFIKYISKDAERRLDVYSRGMSEFINYSMGNHDPKVNEQFLVKCFERIARYKENFGVVQEVLLILDREIDLLLSRQGVPRDMKKLCSLIGNFIWKLNNGQKEAILRTIRQSEAMGEKQRWIYTYLTVALDGQNLEAETVFDSINQAFAKESVEIVALLEKNHMDDVKVLFRTLFYAGKLLSMDYNERYVRLVALEIYLRKNCDKCNSAIRQALQKSGPGPKDDEKRLDRPNSTLQFFGSLLPITFYMISPDIGYMEKSDCLDWNDFLDCIDKSGGLEKVYQDMYHDICLISRNISKRSNDELETMVDDAAAVASAAADDDDDDDGGDADRVIPAADVPGHDAVPGRVSSPGAAVVPASSASIRGSSGFFRPVSTRGVVPFGTAPGAAP